MTMNKNLKEYTLNNGTIVPEKISKDLAELSEELKNFGKRLEADLLKYGRKSQNDENK